MATRQHILQERIRPFLDECSMRSLRTFLKLKPRDYLFVGRPDQSREELVNKLVQEGCESLYKRITELDLPAAKLLAIELGVYEGRDWAQTRKQWHDSLLSSCEYRLDESSANAICDLLELPAGITGDYEDDYQSFQWISSFCRKAEQAVINDRGSSHELEDSYVATLRLVCDCAKGMNDADWLQQQSVELPRDGGYVLDNFDQPEKWAGGRMFISEPSEFLWNILCEAADQDDLKFDLRRADGGQFADDELGELSEAVSAAIDPEDDDSDKEIVMECSGRTLNITIGAAGYTSDSDFKRDRFGVKWRKDSSRRNDWL